MKDFIVPAVALIRNAFPFVGDLVFKHSFVNVKGSRAADMNLTVLEETDSFFDSMIYKYAHFLLLLLLSTDKGLSQRIYQAARPCALGSCPHNDSFRVHLVLPYDQHCSYRRRFRFHHTSHYDPNNANNDGPLRVTDI